MEKAYFPQENGNAVDEGAADCEGVGVDLGLPANPAAERRKSERVMVLIRAAKLVSPQGEFICVVRDVSQGGVSARLFHRPPTGTPLELHMPGGGEFIVETAWTEGDEAGFKFSEPVDVETLVRGASAFPKRGMRLDLMFPVQINSLTHCGEALVENLSQQGARIESEAPFAIEQVLQLDCAEASGAFKEIRAKVRWRRGSSYGLVFDDTMSMRDFACLAARLQCPQLLD